MESARPARSTSPPATIRYPYRPIFDDGTIDVLSYPPETVIAEKFETLVRRGEENSRARDSYDAALLLGLYRDKVDWGTVRKAIMSTAMKWGFVEMMPRYREMLDGTRKSRVGKPAGRLAPQKHIEMKTASL